MSKKILTGDDLNRLLLNSCDEKMYYTPADVLGECIDKDAVFGNPKY